MEKDRLPEKPVDEKKPALLPLVLFLSYITDLVFVALVFVVFLLATWSLHRWGDALGLTNFLVYVRIIELAIISFGTLLCVLFFLKATVEFAKNLKRQLQKPVEGVGGEPSSLHPRDIARRFGKPLQKQNLGWFVFSVVIIVAFLYLGISFAGLVQNNCDDVSILACELMCETGPDFTKPIDANDFEKVLGSYAKYMENKHLAVLLRVFPNYSPKKVFADVNETLGSAKGSQEEVANEIWRAGEEVMLFRLNAPKFLPRGIALHEYRKAAELLLPLAAAALEESENASKLFNKTPTMENSVHSCERNRITMLLLFPLRSSYNRPEVASLFTRFRAVVEACRDSKIDVASLLPNDDPRREFLTEIIAKSEQRRLDILDEIKKRNMQEAIERMWDAIEIAYRDRTKLLELCEKIRSAGNYSEEITS